MKERIEVMKITAIIVKRFDVVRGLIRAFIATAEPERVLPKE